MEAFFYRWFGRCQLKFCFIQADSIYVKERLSNATISQKATVVVAANQTKPKRKKHIEHTRSVVRERKKNAAHDVDIMNCAK